MPDSDALYIDACCFIDAAKIDLADEQARQKWSQQEIEDARWIRQILTAAKDGAVRAFTSGITIAECTTIEKGDAKPSENVKTLFRSMLLSNKVVTLVQADIFICEDARDLRWDHEIVVSGADAIHLATAVHKGCNQFITTDKRILKKQGDVLKKLRLRLVRPALALIPDEYRQHVMPWGGPTVGPQQKKGRKRKR